MAQLREIKKRMGAVKTIQRITKTMQMIAPVTEASGLAWSRSQADLFWTHNDSAVRTSIVVYRVAEPSVAGLPAGATLGAVAPHVVHLTYPDGARDAEALVVDRTTGDLYVITKREARSRVYRVTAAQVAAGIGVMQMVGEMPYGGVVGADACAGGTTIVVKTYFAVRVHQSPLGLAAALLGEGSMRPYVREPQGEAIAVDAACESYMTLSEGLNQPLVRYSP
ncbi:MAG: hypothetical protein EXS04_01345 [Phycisphaerales bacterium]|nr:hypothetical protein [Phycisphaerales bacterium]PHX78542.1 MAG: hypothetical protein CK544_02280 [Planctomycetaceae bacterium]